MARPQLETPDFRGMSREGIRDWISEAIKHALKGLISEEQIKELVNGAFAVVERWLMSIDRDVIAKRITDMISNIIDGVQGGAGPIRFGSGSGVITEGSGSGGSADFAFTVGECSDHLMFEPQSPPRLFLRMVRNRLVKATMDERGVNRMAARRAVNELDDSVILAAVDASPVPRGAIGDGTFLNWIKDNLPTFLSLIASLLPLVLMFI